MKDFKKIILYSIIFMVFTFSIIYFVFGDEVLNPPERSYINGNFTFNISTTLDATINVTAFNLTATDTTLTNNKIIAFAINETSPSNSDTRYFNLTIYTANLSEQAYNITFRFTNLTNSNNFTNVSIIVDRTIPITTFLAETEQNNTFKN